MSRFPDTTRKKTRIEIIPMIDVMMFLLVFFVLLSINVIPALGLKTKLPSSSTAEEQNPPEKIIITLAKDNIVQVNGDTLASIDKLKEAVLKIKADAQDSKLVVFINGDESVQLQELVNVMDILKSSGINAITIATKKK